MLTFNRLAVTTGAALLLLMLQTGQGLARMEDSYDEQRAAYWTALEAGQLAGTELERARETALQMELHRLQLELERFSVDHRVGDEPGEVFYPANLSLLTMGSCCAEHQGGGAYIDSGFYPNPWTAGSVDERNAMCVPCGWTKQAVGNFSYLCQFDDATNVVAYALLAWGPDEHGGLDVDGDGRPDGAVLMLCSGGLRGPDGWAYLWEDELAQLDFSCWENGREVQLHWQREMEGEE